MTQPIRADEPVPEPAPSESDAALLDRARGGEADGFSALMRRYNRRMYRVARSIVGNDNDAQDVVQHAYACAYACLDQFAGASAFSTWLTRIVINEGLARRKSAERARKQDVRPSAPDWRSGTTAIANPEDDASRRELASLLEAAIDELPESYRVTLVLREIEGLTTAEAAACLAISQEAVRVRLHRARALLRADLRGRVGASAADVWGFGGDRCRLLAQRVIGMLTAT
jgi:RNA polymerase sigma-70 factor (ECF subfamily)